MPSLITLRCAVTGFLLAISIACAAPIPPLATDVPLAAQPGKETAVFAGGCFWGVQSVFERVKGVVSTAAGYAGGSSATATYQQVVTETTGHAESVKLVYDPSRITYGQLLRVFFSVAHDPTELNYQGPDEGTQYRSAIFYSDPEQKKIAEAYIAQLDAAGVYRHKIVTQVAPLQAFYPGEGYHQNYAKLHPNDSYIVFNDAPKVANLRKEFPQIYVNQ